MLTLIYHVCMKVQWIYWSYSLLQAVPCTCNWHLLSCYFVEILGCTICAEYTIIMLLTSYLVEYLNGIFYVFVCNCYIYIWPKLLPFLFLGIEKSLRQSESITLYTVSHDDTSHWDVRVFVMWCELMLCVYSMGTVGYIYMYISVAISDS